MPMIRQEEGNAYRTEMNRPTLWHCTASVSWSRVREVGPAGFKEDKNYYSKSCDILLQAPIKCRVGASGRHTEVADINALSPLGRGSRRLKRPT